jgi:hypothetical protein
MTFDTGAYMTSVDSVALSRAGYDIKAGKITHIDTVGRKAIPAREIVLRGLELGDVGAPRLSLGPVLVYAVDMSDTPETVGVIGLNIIKEFTTTIFFGDPTIIKLIPTFDVSEPLRYGDFLSESSRFGLWDKSNL